MISTSGTALPGLTRSLAIAPIWAKAAAVLVGTALLAASTQVTVPMFPVPMTMQTWAVLVIGALYGSRLGAITVLAYIAEGLAGLPVFTAGGFGLAKMMGPTGGYLIGFVISAWMIGYAMERGLGRSLGTSILAFTLAHAVVFVPGVAWLAYLVGADKAIALGVVPFFVGSVVKTALAVATYEAARKVPTRA